MAGKFFLAGALALAVFPCSVQAADAPGSQQMVVVDQPSPWTMSFSQEVRWFDWRSSLGSPSVPFMGARGRGSQVYIPATFVMSGPLSPDLKLEVVARGGYVYSRQRTYGQTGEASTLLDTQLNTTLTYSGWNGFQPFVSVLLNVPTGRSALFGNSRFARVDPDLVDIGSFGEGFNIGPTVGVNIPLSQAWIASFSAGYTYRGPFNKEGYDFLTGLISATERVKNGSTGTISGALAYSEGPVSFQISTTYAFNTTSQVNSPGLFNYQRYRSGDRFIVSASGGYGWNENWSSSASFNFVHSQKNKILTSSGDLATEPFNSNSNLFKLDFAPATYQSTDGWALGPSFGFTYRDRNRYDPYDFGFSPAKTRYSAGVVGRYNISKSVSLNGKLEYVKIREKANIGPPLYAPLVPSLNGHAVAGTFGATVNF